MSAEDVIAAIDDPEEPDPPPPDDLKMAVLGWNDLGNAERLMARHGHDIRFFTRVGWGTWTGKIWGTEDGELAARRLAHLTCKALAGEAEALIGKAEADKLACDLALAEIVAEAAPDTEAGTLDRAQRVAAAKAAVKRGDDAVKGAAKMARFVTASGNRGKLEGMLEEIKPYVALHPRELDPDPLTLSVQNGTLQLTPAVLEDVAGERAITQPARVERRPFRRRDLISKLGGVAYDPDATAPLFQAFLETVLPDKEVRLFVQRFFGYCLTGRISEQVMAVFYGTGANGKSTLIKLVTHVLGSYAVGVPFETFVQDDRKRSSDHTPDLVRMVGARLVTASEPNIGARLSEGTIKTATGGEKIVAREMFEKQFEYLPTFKIILSCNFKPTIRGQDEGIWRRVLIVPFTVSIPRDQQDQALGDKLQAEAPGILNWLLEGFRMWSADGLAVPAAVRAATDEYRQESDKLGVFLAAMTERNERSSIGATSLYRAYAAWCGENAEDPMSQTMFGRKLSDRGIHRDKAGIAYYSGLGLNRDGEALLERAAAKGPGTGGPRDGAAEAARRGPSAGDDRYDPDDPGAPPPDG